MPSALAPGINHVLAYGQSLSSGWEGWPALSTGAVPGCLMLGESVRPRDEAAPVWRPVGEAGFRPLAATVQDLGSGRVLAPAEVAALPPGDPALGETVLEAALGGMGPQGEALWLGSSCGVGGRSVEALSRGAAPELFNRLRDCVALARDTARAAGLPYRVAALLLLQGEQNNAENADRADYKARLLALGRDFARDVVHGVAGQAEPPAIFTYQTGGAYAADAMAVAQAQLELGLQVPGWYLASPSYPASDKGGHLDAAGYRWLGAQFGKVMRRVLVQGQAWRPLHPVAARLRGRELAIDFHAPVPPLAWGRPFRGQARVDLPWKGFSVLDGGGVVPIAAVELAGAACVRITLERAPADPPLLRYADRSVAGGLGCLHDSDPATDRGLALANWCVGFALRLA